MCDRKQPVTVSLHFKITLFFYLGYFAALLSTVFLISSVFSVKFSFFCFFLFPLCLMENDMSTDMLHYFLRFLFFCCVSFCFCFCSSFFYLVFGLFDGKWCVESHAVLDFL